MANLFQPSINRQTDSTGAPASGANLYLYMTETTTPAVYYLDEAGTVIGPHPMVADSNGFFENVYLDSTDHYNVICTDSTGSETFWEVDPVRGFDIGMVQTAAEQAILAATQTAADVVLTHSDASHTAADVVSTDAAVVSATASAALATTAADVALINGNLFTNTTLGLAGTSGSGGTNRFFAVPDTDANYARTYRNDTGTATFINVYPSRLGVNEALDPVLGQVPESQGLSLVGLGDSPFVASSARLIFVAPIDGLTITEIQDWVTVVGGGTYNLQKATGTPGSPTASGSSVSLTAVKGLNTWTVSDIGSLVLNTGEMLWLSSPSGGPQSYVKNGTGLNGYYRAAPFTSGSFTATALGSGVWANTKVEYTQSGISIERASLVDDDLLDEVEELVASVVIGPYGHTGSIINGSNFSNGAVAFIGPVIPTTDRPATVGTLSFYVRTLGTTGAWSVVVARPNGAGSSGIISITSMTPITAIGPQYIDVSSSNIPVSPGDYVGVYGPPTTGIATAQQASGGAGLHYFIGTVTPGLIATDSFASGAELIANYTLNVPGIVVPEAHLSSDVRIKLNAVATTTFPTPTEWVVFGVGGQSNMVGQGNSAQATALTAGICKQYYSGSLTAVTADPIGNANTGSMLPAFAQAFFNETGLGVIFVPCAVTGASMIAAADTGFGNWAVATNTLYNTAKTNILAAMTAATAASLAWRFGGFLWCQGETDADELALGVSGVTAANYKTQFSLLISTLETALGNAAGTMPVFISQTGRKLAGDTSAYVQIRTAQRELCLANPQMHLAYTGAVNFPTRGLQLDTYHYNQTGLNEAGKAMGLRAAFNI